MNFGPAIGYLGNHVPGFRAATRFEDGLGLTKNIQGSVEGLKQVSVRRDLA